MSTPSPVPDIRGTIALAVPAERAFAVFTGSFGTWWPREYHIGQAEMADAIVEPHAGGRWYERGTDGSECDWGRVLAWDPPRRLVVTWQINGQWQYDPDPAHASEIEVRFTPEGPGQTIVELEHRHLAGSPAARPSTTRSCSAAAAGAPSWNASPRRPEPSNPARRSGSCGGRSRS